MIASIIKYFSGYIDFCATGVEIEKIFTFCAKNGIDIISHKKTGYILEGIIFAKDYKYFKKYCRKIGIDIKIIKKHGIYFDLRNNKRKIGFAAGCLFIICFVYIMNLFVWEINVSGNRKIPTEEIIISAKEVGLETGTLRKSHFVQDMEWYILRKHPEIASLEINIQGSTANILVNEIKDEGKTVPDDDMPVNIIASRYGVIRKMDVFDGQGTVKTGDAVMKGDLLVSAVFEDRHNKLTLKHARAKIIAETDYSIQIEFPLEEKILKKDKLYKTTYKIIFLGKIFTIGNYENTEELLLENKEKIISFLGIKLPLNVIITRYFTVKENNVTYNFEQGRQKAYEYLELKEKEIMKDMEILSRTTEEIVKNGKYIINANYIVLMDIAEEQPIESDIPWENTDDMS